MNKEQAARELLGKALQVLRWCQENADEKWMKDHLLAVRKDVDQAVALLKQPECKTCGGSKRKPREKHCKLAHCVKKHARITCRPNGKDCEHYIPSEPCPDCEKPVNSPPTSKEKTAPIIESETGVKKGEVASQHPAISMKVAVDDCDIITDKPPVSEFTEHIREQIRYICEMMQGEHEDEKIDWEALLTQVLALCGSLDKAGAEKESIQKLYDNTMKSLFSAEQRIKDLEALRDTVQISCNPPKDCNDPVVLKKYMKGCFDEAMAI